MLPLLWFGAAMVDIKYQKSQTRGDNGIATRTNYAVGRVPDGQHARTSLKDFMNLICMRREPEDAAARSFAQPCAPCDRTCL